MSLQPGEIKTNRLLLLLIVLLDLIGFSLLFPIIPDLLEHYLKGAPAQPLDAWLPILAEKMKAILPSSRNSAGDFIVLFGGILGSLYSFLQFIVAPHWGKLSDRIGRRPILLVTSVGLALSYLIWAFSASFTAFILTRVFAGLMAGNLSVASAAMADMSSEENRTREMGLLGAAFGVGFVIGPALGGIAAQWDLREYFPGVAGLHPFTLCSLLSFFISAISAVLNIFFFRETLPEEGRDHTWISNPLKLYAGVKTPGMSYLFLVYFLFIFAFSGFEFTVTFYYKLEFFLNPTQIGFIFFYLGILIALGQGGVVRVLSRILGEKTIILIGLTLLFPSFYLFSLTPPSVLWSMAVLFPLAMGTSLVQPAMTGLVSLLAPASSQGLAMGLFRSSGSLARAVGPLGGAYLYWILGAKSAYLVLALLMGAVLFLSLKIRNARS